MERYDFKNQGSRGEIWLYGSIGGFDGISSAQFVGDLKALGGVREIDAHVNSGGGSIFEATGIYTALKDHPATVTIHIDGMALSAASLIAMSGNQIVIARNALLMVHEASAMAEFGQADDLRSMADVLDKVNENLVTTYASRTRLSRAAISEMLAEETWFDAEEAVRLGFADRTGPALQVAAALDLANCKNAPPAIVARAKAAGIENSDRQALADWDKAIAAKVADGMPRHEAVRATVTGSPELHRAYLLASNRSRPRAIRKLEQTG
ncbi:MAG: ATP-dependent Clp protease proteolytic subunit [Planctomycetes bacterium]|nr:ATP-dependent Clp protease proteolytic subunit [Planctomycetota bacterium]